MSKKTVKKLKHLQADSVILTLKAQNYHWNVEGPFFAQLHSLFEEQYEELFKAVDEVSERIRALGEYAPGTYSEFTAVSKIKDKTLTDYKDMIADLVAGHEAVVKTAQDLIKLAQGEDDEATADLAIKRIQAHQKALWMLKSHLKK